MTCPCCRRPIEVLHAIQSRRSADEGRMVREDTFIYHFDRQARECFGSRKTVAEAEGIALTGGST